MKYYPPSDHIYYKDSDIPINKLDLKDKDIIAEIEKELVVKAYETLHTNLGETVIFDEEYLKSVHSIIFSSLYEWGGQYRTVNISKGDSMFCPYINLDSYSHEIFSKLEKDNYLRDFEDISKKEIFVQKLAFYMCELIVLHPFNEGNGRAIRLFFDMIVTYNGYDYIDYKETLKDNEYILASIDCMQANCIRMEKIISNGLVKIL
jgi:cell filamentation protein